MKLMLAQKINLAKGVEDDEEACFLAANPSIVLIIENDVEHIIDRCVLKK